METHFLGFLDHNMINLLGLNIFSGYILCG